MCVWRGSYGIWALGKLGEKDPTVLPLNQNPNLFSTAACES